MRSRAPGWMGPSTLLTDSTWNVLPVKPTYKPPWEGPGGFPQRAHRHLEALAGRVNRRPEPEAATALELGGALPATGYAFVFVPGVVDGAHLEAGCDHGPVFTPYPGMPVELNAHQLALGGDTLNHRGRVLQRQPRRQPTMFRWPEVHRTRHDVCSSPAPGHLAGAAAPAVSQRRVPAGPVAGGL